MRLEKIYVIARVNLIAVILLLLAGLTTGQTTQQPATPVTLTLTITDKTGRYVGGLRKEQITLMDQERPQEIVSLKQTDVPLSVGFLFDTSLLKLADVSANFQKLLLGFMTDSNPANEYFLMGFDSQTYLATDFTRDRKQMADAFAQLRKINPLNYRNLYDAIQAGMKTIAVGQHAKRVIILVSDYKDAASSLKYEALLDQLKRSDVLLYAIRVKAGNYDATQTVLNELSSTTGGTTFYPKSVVEFADSFDVIGLELRHQYTLEYNPESSGDAWHSLKFQVKPLQMKDSTSIPLFPRSRTGYYSHP